MARQEEATRAAARTFIAERARDLAVMYLTRRNDLEVRWRNPGEEGIAGVVEIQGKRRPAQRLFGVELAGSMLPVTDSRAKTLLHPIMQKMLRKRKFPFPVCVLFFTMENNEGRFAWVAEPVLEEGKPALKYHGEAHTRRFDKTVLDEIVEMTNQWFNAASNDNGSAPNQVFDRGFPSGSHGLPANPESS